MTDFNSTSAPKVGNDPPPGRPEYPKSREQRQDALLDELVRVLASINLRLETISQLISRYVYPPVPVKPLQTKGFETRHPRESTR